MRAIYHLIRERDFEALRAKKYYRPNSLLKEGFIHFSFLHQVDDVYKNFYSELEDIMLLKVFISKVRDALKIDKVEDHVGSFFPHLYRELHVDEIEAVYSFKQWQKLL
jgi:uncharacterized protein (DUF952 family)